MSYDLVIRNATLVDGSGGPRTYGSVGISGDRIETISTGGQLGGKEIIEANDMVLAPGFINAHAHDDCALIDTPLMPFKTSQGITTVVNGNCGVSVAPLETAAQIPPPISLLARGGERFFSQFGNYFDCLDQVRASVNSVCLAGHSTLRFSELDDLSRPATDREIFRMKTKLIRAMEDGAVGLSTGLFYPPASAAPTEEVIELAKVLGAYNGLYVTHMRNEAEGVIDSINETARIGREADVPVVISHHKCAGRQNHGRSRETLPKIDEIGAYLEIGMDAYPYAASSTMLGNGNEERASKVLITWSDAMPDAANRELADIANEMGLAEDEAVKKLLPAGGVFFTMDEADVRRILSHPRTVIGSDGIPSDKHPHPRLWGSFPRVLGHYCREIGLFSLEDAVRRMTSATARRFGILDRGYLREGAFADLVLFDPDSVGDRATFETPVQASDGIRLVTVNGQITWMAGKATGIRAGRALRGRHV